MSLSPAVGGSDGKELRRRRCSLSLSFPPIEISVFVKDGGPWSSLNFKLKNTVGYIALLENSLRVRARELSPSPLPLPPPPRCFTPRDKNQIFEYSTPDCNPRVSDFARWIFDRLYNNHAWGISSCRRAQLRPALPQLLSGNNRTVSQKRGFNEVEAPKHERPKSFVDIVVFRIQTFLRPFESKNLWYQL